MRGLLAIIGILILLTACGSAQGYRQAVEGDRYHVELSLDGVGSGERTASLELRDKAGQPVDADPVVLLPVMRSMGMASPEISAVRVAPGRYEARGEIFTMAGDWEIDVRLGSGGDEETVSFKVATTE